MERKDARVTIALEPTLLALILQEAQKTNVSTGAYVRSVLFSDAQRKGLLTPEILERLLQ